MDLVTIDLLSAIDFVLRQARIGHAWRFEEGSEIHIALTEAHTQARIALGIDVPEIPEVHHTKQEVAA